MRKIIDVMNFPEPVWVGFQGGGVRYLAEPGYYAITPMELIGPFSSRAEALRLGHLGAKTKLPRGCIPFKRIVET